MQWSARPLLAAICLLVACGGPAEEPIDLASPLSDREDGIHELAVGDETRSYRLLVPASVQGPGALVIMLHDAGGSPEAIVEVTQLDRFATRHGFAVAYPSALDPAAWGAVWNVEFCCGRAPASEANDIGFVDELVSVLGRHDRIDPDRVVLAGVSNGAILALRYACLHPERIAGVASVAGAMLLDDCQPTTAVSILEIHGTGDQIVPFVGGEMPAFVGATSPIPSVPDMLVHWADVNGCSDPSVTVDEPVTITDWSPCDDGTAVRLIAIEGASHAWYATEFGPVDGAVDATDAILDFFDLTFD